MSSLSLTKMEFLHALTQQQSFGFPAGTVLTISDISIPTSETSNPQSIIKELGEIFAAQKACLSPLSADSIKIEQVSPLRLHVIKPFSLRAAKRANWMDFPFNRFAFRQVAAVQNLQRISRGDGVCTLLPPSSQKIPCEKIIESILYRSHDGTRRSFLEMLQKTYTDGIVVLCGGKILYEKYFDGQDPDALISNFQ